MILRSGKTSGFVFVPKRVSESSCWFLAESDWTWRWVQDGRWLRMAV